MFAIFVTSVACIENALRFGQLLLSFCNGHLVGHPGVFAQDRQNQRVVGVVLSPMVRSTWNSEPVSVLADRIVQALSDALAWPVRAAYAFTGSS